MLFEKECVLRVSRLWVSVEGVSGEGVAFRDIIAIFAD